MSLVPFHQVLQFCSYSTSQCCSVATIPCALGPKEFQRSSHTWRTLSSTECKPGGIFAHHHHPNILLSGGKLKMIWKSSENSCHLLPNQQNIRQDWLLWGKCRRYRKWIAATLLSCRCTSPLSAVNKYQSRQWRQWEWTDMVMGRREESSFQMLQKDVWNTWRFHYSAFFSSTFPRSYIIDWQLDA